MKTFSIFGGASSHFPFLLFLALHLPLQKKILALGVIKINFRQQLLSSMTPHKNVIYLKKLAVISPPPNFFNIFIFPIHNH